MTPFLKLTVIIATAPLWLVWFVLAGAWDGFELWREKIDQWIKDAITRRP